MSAWRTRAARMTLVVTGALAAGIVAPSAAAAEDLECIEGNVPGSEPLGPARTEENPPHDRMGVGRAQELATGLGTTVAVIDSGVAPVEGLRLVDQQTVYGRGDVLKYGHGSIVAGLVAGEDGVAPDAGIYDVRVYDGKDVDPSEGEGVSSAGIVAGIRHVLAVFDQHDFDVVNISLAVGSNDPQLEAAVADLVARDVVVVAAAGNAVEQSEGFEGTPGSDEEVYPADYPGVLAVSAVPDAGEDPVSYVKPNRDTDVAAPTRLAVSYDGLGQRCVVGGVATSWAAAEVSGLVALLRERFPDDTPEQTITRLQATAEGAGPLAGEEARNPWTGAGVVQAHDALTREVRFGRKGALRVSEAEVGADAQAPPAPEQVDLFGSSRALLLWTGLLAGALLALAFMLRPLIRR